MPDDPQWCPCGRLYWPAERRDTRPMCDDCAWTEDRALTDRPLGMAHVTDTQLGRLAASIQRLDAPAPRPQLLPVLVVKDTRERGFEAGPALDGAEVYAVVDGVRVARLAVLPAGWDCC